jgi:hypothetical protein
MTIVEELDRLFDQDGDEQTAGGGAQLARIPAAHRDDRDQFLKPIFRGVNRTIITKIRDLPLGKLTDRRTGGEHQRLPKPSCFPSSPLPNSIVISRR